jgi:antirestriction protein
LNNKQTKTKNKTMEAIKIYVGTYYKYNCGSIAGDWVDVTILTKEEFLDMCETLHNEEKDPEFMYQDWECPNFLNEYISESGIDSKFWDIKEELQNLDDSEVEALNAYIKAGFDFDINEFRDRFFCHIDDYNVNRAFGDYMLEEMGEMEQIPQHLRYYIDSELYGRDLLISDFTEFEGYIFRNC